MSFRQPNAPAADPNSRNFKQLRLKYDLVNNAAITMIAKRGSGKSWLVRDLMEFWKDIPAIVVISKTEKVNPFYTKFCPDLYVYENYTPELIAKILERQELIIEKSEKKAKEGKKVDPRLLLIMDDCLADAKSWAKDEGIRQLLMNGRHFHITYILTMQYPLGIPPELRANFDYAFILADTRKNMMKRYYENFAGMFDNVKEFETVLQELTDDHGSMVLNYRSKSAALVDQVFWYKARDVSPKFIGSRQYNKFAELNYDPESSKRRLFVGQKSKIGYNVRKAI